MRKYRAEQLQQWNACHDIAGKLPSADWEGTALDILEYPGISFMDKMWCLTRGQALTDGRWRRYAVAAARIGRSKKIAAPFTQLLDLADEYADGKATLEELLRAHRVASDARVKMKAGYARDKAKVVCAVGWESAPGAAWHVSDCLWEQHAVELTALLVDLITEQG